jgi:hypothetical protein
MAFAISAGVLMAGSAYMNAQAQNASMEAAQKNAERRYGMQAAIAGNQMEEQNMLAMEKMTEVTRKFLLAKGKATTVQAETMVGGNVQKRLSANLSSQSSEIKGKVAQEVNTNIINVATDMLAKKIDTEAMIAEAESKKKSSLAIAVDMGLGFMQGAAAGAEFNKAMSGLGGSGGASGASGAGANTGVKNLFT